MKRWLAVAVAAGVLVVVGIKIWLSQQEQARVAERAQALASLKADVKRLGGQLELDSRSREHPVSGIDLSGTGIEDNDFSSLFKYQRLMHLRKLDLSGTQITEESIDRLLGLESLRSLRLGGSRMSYAGYSRLKSNLPRTSINIGLTGSEFKRDDRQVQAIYEIKLLGGKVEIDDSVAGRPVTGVDLSSTRVRDSDLSRLKAFPQLVKLQLGGTRITDEGLTRLTGFASLETLLLGGTLVTDAGVPHLAKIKSLKKIFLGETRVTYAGYAELHKLLPAAQINRW